MKQKNYDEENENFEKAPFKKDNDDNKILKIQELVESKGKKILTYALIIIIAIGAGVIIKINIDKSNKEHSENASLALSRIISYYQQSDYQKALYGDTSKTIRNEKIIGLVEIVKQYEDTPSGMIAALYAGDCFANMDKYNEAQKYFEIAIKSESELVQMGANAGLGACSEMNNDYQSAAKYYQTAADKAIATDTKNRYQFYAALCLEEAKDFDKAAKIYNDIIAENKSQFVGYSKAGLTRLGKTVE